jgi:membrane dipeptidase
MGSDFDGGISPPFIYPNIYYFIEQLEKNNFSEVEIKKIMGENIKKFLLKNLP